MNDAFGRRINQGDIVVYVTRAGSSQWLNVARVLEVEDDRAKVDVMAGTDHKWEHGKSRWSSTCDDVPRRRAHEGHMTWIRAEANVMVANGIDALGIRELVIHRQRKSLSG